jgi:tetratricopeptide (TPR) repeat protein
MVAGDFDEDYDKRLTRFGWEVLYAKAPALFRALAARLAREYSFTFIDSRTGLSDTSGICTMLMPTSVVMVFTPNAQSITGVEHLVRRAVDYRVRSSDSRPFRVYPLPSRVDNQVELFRTVWRMGDPNSALFGSVQGYQPMFADVFTSVLQMNGDDARQRLTEYFDVVQVPHSADYAYGERLCFTSTAPTDALSVRNSYEQFLPWLVTGAQPWERSAVVLANHRAALWLHDAGAETPPAAGGGDPNAIAAWNGWFDRLASVLDSLQDPVLAEYGVLARDYQFDVSVVMALAYAWRDDLDRSLGWLNRAEAARHDDLDSGLADDAPAQLLRLWVSHRSTAFLRSTAHRRWVETADRLLAQWQPLRNQRRSWLMAVAALAAAADWFAIERRALEQVIEVNRQALGEAHRDTLSATIDLASALRAHGDLRVAKAMQERALEMCERALGAEDEYTLVVMNNLASTLRELGQLATARHLLERTCEISRRTLGDNARFTLAAMTNLAGVLRAEGDLRRAHELQRLVVAASRSEFGDDADETLAAINNLAGTLLEMGERADARSLQEQIVLLREQRLGTEHPDTLAAIGNLAATLQASGDLTAARDLLRKAFETQQRILGDDHADTLTAMNNLASVLFALEDFNAARDLQERTVDARRRLLGEDHPDTLVAMSSLARTCAAQEDWQPAQELAARTLETRLRTLGFTDAAVLNDVNFLALVLQRTGDLARARTLLSFCRKAYGDGHATTLRVMDCVGTMLRTAGFLDDALEVETAAVGRAREVLGADHTETLRMMMSLALIHTERGDLPRAVLLLEESWTGLRRALGDEDQDTWAVGVLLATNALRQNPARAAEVLDTFKSPALTTSNPSWLGLRLRAAEALGNEADIKRYQRLTNDLLTRPPMRQPRWS